MIHGSTPWQITTTWLPPDREIADRERIMVQSNKLMIRSCPVWDGSQLWPPSRVGANSRWTIMWAKCSEGSAISDLRLELGIFENRLPMPTQRISTSQSHRSSYWPLGHFSIPQGMPAWPDSGSSLRPKKTKHDFGPFAHRFTRHLRPSVELDGIPLVNSSSCSDLHLQSRPLERNTAFHKKTPWLPILDDDLTLHLDDSRCRSNASKPHTTTIEWIMNLRSRQLVILDSCNYDVLLIKGQQITYSVDCP
jgi:hypothetical protein